MKLSQKEAKDLLKKFLKLRKPSDKNWRNKVKKNGTRALEQVERIPLVKNPSEYGIKNLVGYKEV